MQFKLTEKEITAGVHHAVSLMGFDLTGKSISIAYTMTGRAKNHLNAEVTIHNPAVDGQDQVVIPGFTDTDEVKKESVDTAGTSVPSIAELDENKPEAEEVKVESTETKPAAQGADAAALFGDDD